MKQRCKNTKFTNEEWVELAKNKHINTDYDYSKVDYKNNGTSVIIICKKNNHGEFRTTPGAHIQYMSQCPKCRKKILSYEDSFASHEKSAQWSDKNDLKPYEVPRSSGQKFYFTCDNRDCKHEIYISPNRIQAGKWCGYCPPQSRKLCANNHDSHCKKCYNKSFASIQKSKFWSKDNKTKPWEICKSSGQKYIFDCPRCNNKYESNLLHVTNGRWCKCKHKKTEQKLYDFLVSFFGKDKIEREITIAGCKNINLLKFDFCIEKYKIIIEIDGRQHFAQVWDWTDPFVTQQTDIYKMTCANENGYTVIRLLQMDVWNDKNNWKFKLLMAIKGYSEPTNLFFGDCYDNHKAGFIDESNDDSKGTVTNGKLVPNNYKEWKDMINASTLKTHDSKLFRMRF